MDEQSEAEYLALNPMGQVPALVHNDKCFSQSVAIMEYLEEAFQDKQALLPKDSQTRAKVILRRKAFWIRN